jgi:diaminohydroxyphosphoribosylaminopyrimidine deaminase/5-amino-6-(5-phosphoribosylamino)uracil reductase
MAIDEKIEIMTPANWTELDRMMMQRALGLAAHGIGLVSPSPLVGCVIANDRGEILGEGAYIYDDVSHAETIALEQAGDGSKGATAYVSLEPHAHHGRTSPCTDALYAAGIRRVVAPIEDPNPKVSGRGFVHLRDLGVQVEVGLMAREAERLNEKYIHFFRKGRPFVHLKLACSIDGRIATRTGDSRWISGPKSRARSHEMRHEYDAILVGSETLVKDNPLLTDRSGNARRRPLLRIVLDRSLRFPQNSQLARTAREAPVLVFTSERSSIDQIGDLHSLGVETLRGYDGDSDLKSVMDELVQREIQSLIVEGGGTIAGALLSTGLIDKVTFFIAPMIIGGTDAPCAIGGPGVERVVDAYNLREVEITPRGSDFEVTGYLG